MYKSLLSDYEASQRALMLENAELQKVLQQMKKEMMHILSPCPPLNRGGSAEESQELVIMCFCVFFKHVCVHHNTEKRSQT